MHLKFKTRLQVPCFGYIYRSYPIGTYMKNKGRRAVIIKTYTYHSQVTHIWKPFATPPPTEKQKKKTRTSDLTLYFVKKKVIMHLFFNAITYSFPYKLNYKHVQANGDPFIMIFLHKNSWTGSGRTEINSTTHSLTVVSWLYPCCQA